jgi:hypothetical protein
MEKTLEKLSFNSWERKFYFREKSIELSEGFEKAETCSSEIIKRKYCLKLFYDNNKEIYDEAVKICRFLKQNNLWEDFEIKLNQDEKDSIYLIGNEIKINSIDYSKGLPIESMDLP